MIVAALVSALLAAGAVDSYDDQFDTRPVLTLDDVTFKLSRHPASAYPEAAAFRGIEGEATIICHIRGSGRVGDCRTESETPANAQFGNATAKFFISALEIGSATKTGEPTAGRRIRLHKTWRITGGAAYDLH